MKKSFLWTMAAIALVGCSQDDLMNESLQVSESNAITFSTYVSKNATSRASVVDTEHIKLHGFGVNAYYTGDSTFTATLEEDYEGLYSTFMDNTKVTYDKERGCWTYSPLKYWSNRAGDMLSFFAYAPYKSEQIEFPDNDNRSKLIFHVDSVVKKQVDLVYHKAQGDESKRIAPTVDLKKPTINSTVDFNFLHALSRISFNVKAVVDDTNANSDNLLDGNTHINIRRIALVSADTTYKYEPGKLEGPFYVADTLNLLNGEWGHNKEITQGFELNGENFYRAVDVDNTPNDASDDAIQLTKFNPSQKMLNDDSYVMIIPQSFKKDDIEETIDGYRIYIEYDVVSELVNNNGTGANIITDKSVVSHKVYSDPMYTNFIVGKAYAFNLSLGMTSLKLDATVATWGREGEREIWLPNNED